MVRTHPDPPSLYRRGCSSVGRAPALQAGGHRFDPVHLHHNAIEKSKISAMYFVSLISGFSPEAVLLFKNMEEVKVVHEGVASGLLQCVLHNLG
jgi:hypothetical protein